MNKHHKRYVVTGLLSAVILTPLAVQSVRAATTTEPVAEQADITNWIANTPEQISANMSRQNINLGDLNGTRYVVQWGDTLSQVSAVTHISVVKLAYDNQIKNIDLIYVGQVLILNANGYVPQSYSYSGNGQGVA